MVVHFFVILVSVDNVLPMAVTVEAVVISGAVASGDTFIVQMGVFFFEKATVIVGSVTIITDTQISKFANAGNTVTINDNLFQIF